MVRKFFSQEEHGVRSGSEKNGGRKRKKHEAARCRLTTGSVRLPTKASFACHLLHHLVFSCFFCSPLLPSVVLLPSLLLLFLLLFFLHTYFHFLRSLFFSFFFFFSVSLPMHRCVRSLHNYYSYHG